MTMITASINVGDVNLENLQTQGLDLTSNVGDTDLENCSLGDVTIRANVGDVYLDNVSFTDLDITADVGDISVDSTQDLSAHSMVLNAGAGEVSVNNEDYRHSYAQTGSGGYAITLKSNVGDVELYY